ncbi:hypothetical protein TPHA_0A04340 [Tetrapisispora phaffii CBS 4417]|uniref:3-oxo-5-alpha-steroid 4-dehydrogenase C-terminal domain-containing protein n=1 Tax=Tetrapisispora phaffii (strain ATCC 24235 / CBS 4417 / NBRC 1672 / NRRL Y-8282 / UCD 70-5) TaxID=1071381 RepID=G8BNN0_TETPH|nr:hypothetical protein TPHA_0A04340 [Tetrapisispora phaffii CBS 4417]CCE61508.1 hypothetical protein TPHA_0A04340 [Tetrapisispora phaffii CBS 4417]
MVSVIKSRSKSLKDTEVEISNDVTLSKLLQIVSEKNKNINSNRLRLTYSEGTKQVPIVSDDILRTTINNADTELFVKDLGPQISWRLVFVLEYVGPILIHSLLYGLAANESIRGKISNANKEYDPSLNKVLYSMVMLHYLKREFESLFVHSFSQSTMPFFNLFKNTFHYWVLNGAIALSYFGYGYILDDMTIDSIYSRIGLSNLSLIVALFCLFEGWNLYIHIKLRTWGDAQKKLGNATKRVPINEGVFNVFVAPNYTFEVWAWIWFTVASKLNLFSMIFLIVSATQMYFWAQKKNKKYGTRRQFLIPYIF